MMNQPLRRVDPLGRSAPSTDYIPNDAWLTSPSGGSAWPISTGSMRAIVDSLLLADVTKPPLETIGALSVDRFLSKRLRAEFASALNALVLGVVLEGILTWVRGLSGSKGLRALIVFDEVYGFLPPHPANPPTKRPLVSLMKQARAYGVGVVIAPTNSALNPSLSTDPYNGALVGILWALVGWPLPFVGPSERPTTNISKDGSRSTRGVHAARAYSLRGCRSVGCH